MSVSPFTVFLIIIIMVIIWFILFKWPETKRHTEAMSNEQVQESNSTSTPNQNVNSKNDLGKVLLGVGLLVLILSLYFTYEFSHAAHPFLTKSEWDSYFQGRHTMAIIGDLLGLGLAIYGGQLISKKTQK